MSAKLTKKQYEDLSDFRERYADASRPDMAGVAEDVVEIVEEIISLREELEDKLMDLDEVLMGFDDEDDQ